MNYQRAKRPTPLMRRKLSPWAIASWAAGALLLAVLLAAVPRVLRAASQRAPVAVEQPVVQAQITGEFDPAENHRFKPQPGSHEEMLATEMRESLKAGLAP